MLEVGKQLLKMLMCVSAGVKYQELIHTYELHRVKQFDWSVRAEVSTVQHQLWKRSIIVRA